VKLNRRFVGDNNNKVTTPNLIIYRRLLLKTPTRAVHVLLFPMVCVFTIHPSCHLAILFQHFPTIHLAIAPSPAREAGTTIIEKTIVLRQTEAREVGET
jgi:hypothetical protein